MSSSASTASAPISTATVRQSLRALLSEVTGSPSGFGYVVTAVSFGNAVEITLDKQGAAFVLWLGPASQDSPAYRTTARLKIGYHRDPPDRQGYALLDAACRRIALWERSLPDGALSHLFEATPPVAGTTAPGTASVDSATEALLSQATFTPIYREWLALRERQLATRFEHLAIRGKKNLLLVNATKGRQFYPSVADFFAVLQRIQLPVQVTSVSYFEDIFELQRGVATKGLQVASVADLAICSAAEINHFDAVLLIGASDAIVRLMALPGLTAKLILLDLAFNHQLLESHPGTFAERKTVIENRSSQINRVTAYSCQPEEKVAKDWAGVCSLHLFDWHWFNYIPIGFTYCTYYQAHPQVFDVGLLGTAGRDFAQIDPARFRGRRFLFLGRPDHAPEIERLRAQLDLTAISGVDEDVYARLLALCRCVVLPMAADTQNAFLSVIDTVATGKPLITTRHPGLARLERDGLPAVFYAHASPADLFAQVDGVLNQAGRAGEIAARSIAFAKEQLDVYRILWRILEEQMLHVQHEDAECGRP